MVGVGEEDYHIVLVDPHTLIRREIRGIIEREPGLKVVDELDDIQQLQEFIEVCLPHLIILDLSLGGMRSVEAALKIKARHPQLQILVLSTRPEEEYRLKALATGVEGYLLKDDADPELLAAIAALRRSAAGITGFPVRES